MLYIYSLPPDDMLQICPKKVEVERRYKLRVNSASSWVLLHTQNVLFIYRVERKNQNTQIEAIF